MNSALTETVFFSIPEGIVVICLAYSFLGQKCNWIHLLGMAAIFGVITDLIQRATGSYVLNIIIATIILIVLLKLFGPSEISEAVMAGFMAISLYLTIEFLNINILQMLSGHDPTVMESNIYMQFAWFLPQIAATAGLSILIRYTVSHIARRRSPKVTDNEN